MTWGIGVFAAFWLAAGSAAAMSYDEARHLLARTGFGAPTAAEVEAIQPLTLEAAVDRLLATTRGAPATPPPDFVFERPLPQRQHDAMSEQERRDYDKVLRDRRRPLKEWWFAEMATTDSPFTERMVLFWHNHFTSSLEKVRWLNQIYDQNLLLRRMAFGNFGDLLRAVTRDPAMLLYLDSQSNRVGAPNENFAREVMELFTLGEGRGYTERDIKEAARAFTGLRAVADTGEVGIVAGNHDSGFKTILGRYGMFRPDDLIDILLAQPQLAESIIEKLWREFVSPVADPAEVKRLAHVFRASGYEMKPVLRALLTSPAFRDPANRGLLVKSPADLVVGTVRLVGYAAFDRAQAVQAMAAMGQDLMDPPNVKGWPGAEMWITTTSLPQREQFLNRITRGLEEGAKARRQGTPAAAGSAPPRPAAPTQTASAAPTGGMGANSMGSNDMGSNSMGSNSMGNSMGGGMAAPAPASAPMGLPTIDPARIANLDKLVLALPAVFAPPAGGADGRLTAMLLDPAYHLK